MGLLVNHMQGKIYLNITRHKRELCFECELLLKSTLFQKKVVEQNLNI